MEATTAPAIEFSRSHSTEAPPPRTRLFATSAHLLYLASTLAHLPLVRRAWGVISKPLPGSLSHARQFFEKTAQAISRSPAGTI